MIFVYYLLRKQQLDEKKDIAFTNIVDRFNNTVEIYLKDSIESRVKMAMELAKFTDTNKELRGVLEKMCIYNMKLVNTNKKV
mgnify:CR=1 FL=1